MKKFRSSALILVVIPLLIPLYFHLTHKEEKTPNRLFNAGGFYNDRFAEQATIKKLNMALKPNQLKGDVRIIWTTHLKDPRPKNRTSLFALKYWRSDGRLVKYASPCKSCPPQPDTVEYTKVSDEMIEAVVAQNGVINDLTKHGAIKRIVKWK
jgi:hypothetical protein